MNEPKMRTETAQRAFAAKIDVPPVVVRPTPVPVTYVAQVADVLTLRDGTTWTVLRVLPRDVRVKCLWKTGASTHLEVSTKARRTFEDEVSVALTNDLAMLAR